MVAAGSRGRGVTLGVARGVTKGTSDPLPFTVTGRGECPDSPLPLGGVGGTPYGGV